ncbi:MAG: putative lipid II flippase FtsW [Chloroflexota bacterium]|nr:putative lipid II flippase FtsW [Chloroflexota bacterium]
MMEGVRGATGGATRAGRAGQAVRRARATPGVRATHEPDYWLLVTVVALVVFGTVIIFSATIAKDLGESGGTFYYLRRHLFFVALGAVAFAATMRIDYHAWRRFSVAALIGAILLLVLVLIPGLGAGDHVGARRWLKLGPLPQFQPGELAKAALILYLADWLTKRGARLRQWSTGLIPFSVLLGVLVLLVMLQPDLGTSFLLAIIGVAMLLVAGADLRQFGLFLLSGVLAFYGLILAAPYRRARLELFMKSEEELRLATGGWQLFQARLATGSGGLLGVGLGASRLKYGWLPEAHTDAIFAVVGEELGLLGCACLLALFLLLAVRGYRVALRAPDAFGVLLATGVVSWIVFQALINIGGITTTIPFTGVPLPFISYGGTSLVVIMATMGVLLNISRQTIERGTRS